MKRLVCGLVVAATLVLMRPALAQDAPVAPASSPAVVQEDEESTDARPWGRLLVFIPVSALLGAGAVVGRRLARERGWTRS